MAFFSWNLQANLFKIAGNTVRLSNLLAICHLQSTAVQNCWQQCQTEQPACNLSPTIHSCSKLLATMSDCATCLQSVTYNPYLFKIAGNNVKLSNLLAICYLQSISVQNCWQQCQTELPACNLSPAIHISVQNCWQQCQAEQPALNLSPAIHILCSKLLATMSLVRLSNLFSFGDLQSMAQRVRAQACKCWITSLWKVQPMKRLTSFSVVLLTL